jgi:hypothetical protein
MGGAACQIIIRAKVRYQQVPQHAKERKELEVQLRECYFNPTIAAVVGESEQTAMAVCDIFAKPSPMHAADLQTLLNALPEYVEEPDDTPGG